MFSQSQAGLARLFLEASFLEPHSSVKLITCRATIKTSLSITRPSSWLNLQVSVQLTVSRVDFQRSLSLQETLVSVSSPELQAWPHSPTRTQDSYHLINQVRSKFNSRTRPSLRIDQVGLEGKACQIDNKKSYKNSWPSISQISLIRCPIVANLKLPKHQTSKLESL